MQIVTISDTHMAEPELPKGDILIHAGDMTFKGRVEEVTKQLNWLEKQKHKYKNIILIPGNHDHFFEKSPALAREECKQRGLVLLNEDEITIEGIKFYGSPITPFFHNWAFNRHPEDIKVHWDIIPDDVNILVTHGPAYGILDGVPTHKQTQIGYDKHYRPIFSRQLLHVDHVGCPSLLERIKELKQLRLHVFGHIHPGYGIEDHFGIKFVNPSHMDDDYRPVNKPIIVEI